MVYIQYNEYALSNTSDVSITKIKTNSNYKNMCIKWLNQYYDDIRDMFPGKEKASF